MFWTPSVPKQKVGLARLLTQPCSHGVQSTVKHQTSMRALFACVHGLTAKLSMCLLHALSGRAVLWPRALANFRNLEALSADVSWQRLQWWTENSQETSAFLVRLALQQAAEAATFNTMMHATATKFWRLSHSLLQSMAWARLASTQKGYSR